MKRVVGAVAIISIVAGGVSYAELSPIDGSDFVESSSVVSMTVPSRDMLYIHMVMCAEGEPGTLLGAYDQTGALMDVAMIPREGSQVSFNITKSMAERAAGSELQLQVRRLHVDSAVASMSVVSDDCAPVLKYVNMAEGVGVGSDKKALVERETVPAIKAGVYPNPFNPRTVIKLTLGQPSSIELEVYNMRGQCIAHLVRGRFAKGNHEFEWSGENDNGQLAPSGVYFYKAKVGEEIVSGKMALLK